MKDKKKIFLVSLGLVIIIAIGISLVKFSSGSQEKNKEFSLNSSNYNSKVLEFLDSIAGIKAEELEIINNPTRLKGTLFAPKESILNGVNYFLENTQNSKMENVAIDTEENFITISVDYKVTKKIKTPIEVKVSPKLNDNGDLVINIEELKLLDIKISKWIRDIVLDNFIEDWFKEDNNIEFTEGAVIIGKENFKGIEIENLEVENEGLRIKAVIDLEVIMSKK